MSKRLNEKLATALPWHYKEASCYREKRREFLRDWAGRTTYPAYDALDDNAEKQIENLTMQAAEAFVMNLAANRPRFSCTSRYVQYEAFAERMARGLDRYAEELYLEEVLQEICRDAFASVGVAKVYQASSVAVGVETDYRMDPGRPFVQRISLDRLVWDTAASSDHEVQFVGDFYSMPIRQALRSPRFSPAAKKRIREAGPEEWEPDDDKGEDLAKSQNDHPIEEVIFLVDVFLRLPVTIGGQTYKSQIRTFLCDRKLELRDQEPVQVLGWNGAECGPYYFLNMGPVPDHMMPSSPGQNQKLLAQLVNTLDRKLEEQCRRQKNIGVARKGSGDFNLARNARDGEWIEFDAPEDINIMRMDGPDQNVMGAAVHFRELHSQHAGNLKHKLGLASAADTASQERMIGAMVSRMEAFYQQRYVSFVRRVARGLAQLIYFDTELTIPGKWKTPGDYIVDDDFLPYGTVSEDGEPSRPEGEYEKILRVDIDPYSMGYQSPGETAAFIDAQMTKWLPAVPFLAQQGVQPDVPAYFEIMADLTGRRELTRIFKSNQAPMLMEGSSGSIGSAGGPNGQYEHVSRSTRSPESEAMQYFQAPTNGAA